MNVNFVGAEFSRKESAIEHEHSHKKQIKLIEPGSRYSDRALTVDSINLIDCYNLNCHGFPDEIEVEDDFGNIACYQYESMAKVNK